MPFDPAIPVDHTTNSAAQMRGQLTALKALIDAVQTVTAAQVDGVTTLNPGDAATVLLTVTGTTLHLTFGIPRGADGNDGTQGPPFADAVVDGVSTLNPGDAATVTVSFDGTNVHFTFGLPRGADGTNGTDGGNGTDGAPGEVTNAALAAALDTTSSNTNAVALLGLTVSDPPTQAEMQAVANKLDELITAQRR